MQRASLLALVTAASAAALAAALGPACLVESLCVADIDCPYPQRCLPDGACGLECTASAPETCPAERPECLVSENRCVECLETEDCGGSDECITNSCVPSRAPDFRLVDDNPTSPSYGEVVALSDLRGRVVLLFFAGLG